MNQHNLSKFQDVCRTCLDTNANIPIFTEERDPASYSEIVYTVTGVKVGIHDGLPQNMCQNCLNNINNCLDFRKQCKESETQLLIMKSQIDSEYDLEIKLENDKIEIWSENLKSNELKQKEIAIVIQNIKVKEESKKNDEQKHNINDKIELTENLKNVSNAMKQKDYIESNTVGCKLCKKTTSKRKYHTHKPTKSRSFLCKICNIIYFNKNQLHRHKFMHRENNPKQVIDSDVSLNNSTTNLTNKSFNSEIDTRHTEIINESILSTSTNNNTGKQYSNNNSDNENEQNDILTNHSMATENENFSNEQNDVLINNSMTTENDNFCNDKHNNDNDLVNKLIDSKVDSSSTNNKSLLNNVVVTDRENFSNDNYYLIAKVKNCFNDSQKDENCFNNTQEVENFYNDAEADKNVTENILYNYNSADPKRVTCKLCQKDLSIRSVDSHVVRSHPGADKRRVKCDLCDNYVLKSKLVRHKTLMHGAQGFICRYCKTEFDNKEGLVEHIRSCSAKKKRRNSDTSRELAECEVCHKTMQKGSLKLHTAMKHAGLRPVCEHCGKSFGNKFRLHDHYRAKHGYEKYKCSHCHFQSACSLAMRNHERRHRGEKPFVCESCGAKFHASYLLAQHRQSHATDKAFQCELCPASFKVNNTLHMHRRACHSTCKYACTVCARTYSTRHYVVKHMRAMHRYTGPVPELTPIPQ